MSWATHSLTHSITCSLHSLTLHSKRLCNVFSNLAMKFLLINTGLPFLVLIAAIFWTIFYNFFVNRFSKFLRTITGPCRFGICPRNKVVFCFHMQDGRILLSIFVIHHSTSAAMMILWTFQEQSRHVLTWSSLGNGF
jgi:hypothetical protein